MAEHPLPPRNQRQLPPQAAARASGTNQNTAENQGNLVNSDNPLQGIKFAPLAAAGPSGSRNEHIRECLAIRKRLVANRLLRLLGELIRRGLDGSLPDTARWILGSNVTFLEKPGMETPRPIRACEWLRKIIGKSLMLKHRAAIIP